VCQLHTAVAALIRSWWSRSEAASERLLEKTAQKIAYYQRRQARARQSHAQTTQQRLREAGIQLADVPQCAWEDP
jgi:hypothetical protein